MKEDPRLLDWFIGFICGIVSLGFTFYLLWAIKYG